MTTRRRFTADSKARIALSALRADKTIREIATKHKVHPNQVSSWKRQALDGLGAVYSNGSDHARRDPDSEVRELHAKIGEWIDFYNTERPHSALAGQTPAEAYGAEQPMGRRDKPNGLPTSPQAQQPQQDLPPEYTLPSPPNCPTMWDHLSMGSGKTPRYRGVCAARGYGPRFSRKRVVVGAVWSEPASPGFPV